MKRKKERGEDEKGWWETTPYNKTWEIKIKYNCDEMRLFQSFNWANITDK